MAIVEDASVGDYMNTKIITQSSKATLLDVAKTMADRNVSSIAITSEDGRRVIGIMTERDIVNSIAKGVSLNKATAELLMSNPVISIRNTLPIEDAARIMLKNKVRHLLVESQHQELAGMITSTDLARYLKQRISKTASSSEGQTGLVVKELHQQEVSSSSSTEILSEVWELFF